MLDVDQLHPAGLEDCILHEAQGGRLANEDRRDCGVHLAPALDHQSADAALTEVVEDALGVHVRYSDPGHFGEALALASGWPDDTTRALLTERTIETDAVVRNTALEFLGLRWRDGTTHALLTEHATTDSDREVRRIAVATGVGVGPTTTPPAP